jgi:hypothetical protein
MPEDFTGRHIIQKMIRSRIVEKESSNWHHTQKEGRKEGNSM